MENLGLKESHKMRNLLDLWESTCDVNDEIEKINGIFDKHGLILFLKRGEDYYGAPENSRLMFAKIKSNDADNPVSIGMRDQIRIPAFNLMKAMSGNDQESIQVALTPDDLEDMEVCDREKTIDALMNYKKI